MTEQPMPTELEIGGHLAASHGWELWYVVHIYRSFGTGGLCRRHIDEHADGADRIANHNHTGQHHRRRILTAQKTTKEEPVQIHRNGTREHRTPTQVRQPGGGS